MMNSKYTNEYSFLVRRVHDLSIHYESLSNAEKSKEEDWIKIARMSLLRKYKDINKQFEIRIKNLENDLDFNEHNL